MKLSDSQLQVIDLFNDTFRQSKPATRIAAACAFLYTSLRLKDEENDIPEGVQARSEVLERHGREILTAFVNVMREQVENDRLEPLVSAIRRTVFDSPIDPSDKLDYLKELLREPSENRNRS
jgi:hypothetical protein